MNEVILIGRLVKDVDYRATQSGTSVAKFTVAVNRRFKNKQTGDYDTDFIDCAAFKSTADFLNRYFHKGSKIVLEGTLQNNNWTDNSGVKHYTYIVVANNVEFGESKGNSQPQQPQQQNPQTFLNDAQNAGIDLNSLDGFDDIISDGVTPF